MTDYQAFFDSYSAAWRANDAKAIEAHWFKDGPAPLYKPEEIFHFIADWDALRAYWQHNEQFHSAVELRLHDPIIRPVSDDLDIVVARMRWDILFAPDAKMPDGAPFIHRGTAMGGHNHVLMMFKKTPDGPRLTMWSETPDAPVSYVAELYKKDVSEGFPKTA